MRELWLPFGVSTRSIYGGPYHEKPKDYVGIKVAAEIKDRCSMHVPIRDFSVPLKPDQMNEALAFALDRIAEDMPLYVGCMGGVGRTGLFLTLLVKSLTGWDGERCIEYVRANYNAHAVETPQQELYVAGFDVRKLRKLARRAKFKAVWFDVKALFGVRPATA